MNVEQTENKNNNEEELKSFKVVFPNKKATIQPIQQDITVKARDRAEALDIIQEQLEELDHYLLDSREGLVLGGYEICPADDWSYELEEVKPKKKYSIGHPTIKAEIEPNECSLCGFYVHAHSEEEARRQAEGILDDLDCEVQGTDDVAVMHSYDWKFSVREVEEV